MGHISTKCRVLDVYCSICKNTRHVTAACRTMKTTTTTAATAGSAPKINNTQEEHKGPEELWMVSQCRKRGSVHSFVNELTID